MANSILRGAATCIALGVLGISLTGAAASAPVATIVSLTSSPLPANYVAGQTVTYTASLGSVSGTPTGTISFIIDGTAGTPTPVDPSHTASVVAHPLAGTHSISATYSGDANYQASASAALIQTVSKAMTTIQMTSNPAQIAQPVAIRAAVSDQSPGAASPTGTVDFSNGTNAIAGCSKVPVQNGVAICNTSFPQVGSFTIGTIYNGDANTISSGGSLQLAVGKCSAGAYLAADLLTPANGAAVTLGFLATGAPGVAAPTGTVSYSDGTVLLATLTLDSNGHAALIVPSGMLAPFAPGTHNINAVYNGDSNYGASQAAPVSVVMTGKAGTTTTVTANASQIGQPVKIAAAISAAGSASSVGGTVDFTNAASPIASCTGVPVQSGAAVCNTSFSQAGTLTINASYSGDTNNASSKGATQLTVGKSSALATLTASPTNAASGSAVTLSVMVSGAPGLATPTGTVVLTDGTAALGMVPLDTNGKASLAVPSGSLPAFTIGTHSIAAAYGGDANYLAGTAAPVPVVVTKAATVVTLSSTQAQIAQPVKITATLPVSTAGGTVDFSNAASPIAGCTGVPVQNGAAICNTSFPQIGNLTIGASYSGDTNFAPGTASLSLAVGKCSPGAYLAASPAAPVYGAAISVGALVLGATGVPNPTGTVTFSDGSTALATVSLGSDGKATLVAPSGSLAALNTGSHSISAVYNGDANYLAATAPSLVVVVAKAPTTVTVTANPASPTPGQSTTLTATVSPAGSGTVVFANGSNAIVGCSSVTVQSGSAVCLTSFPQSGTLAITASYSGDANTNAASGSYQLTVAPPAKAAAAPSLSATPTAPVFGATVVLTVTVPSTTGGPAPTGTVAFSDGATALGSLPLNALGQVSLTAPSGAVAALAVGTHTISAVYSGDSSYAGGSATPLTVTVAKAVTSTALTAPYGGPFTATIAVLPPGSGTPTGQVQFSSAGLSIGTAALQAQGGGFVASLPRNTQAGSIIATYQGDSNFASSASLPVTVTAPTAQATLASNHNPSTFGQAVTLTVYVSNNSGPGTPTGSVQLLADGTNLGTVTLASGIASLTTSSLAIGTHNIVANYAGDATYPATSAGLLQVVNQGTATLALSSSSSSSVFGQPVTFSAQFSTPSGSTAPSSGQVQFSDGTTVIGSAAMAAGGATLTVANLAAGTHSVTASWGGDGNWGPVTSGPLSQVVSKAQTSTALAATTTLLTATIAVVAPGAGQPTGSVKFVNATSNAVLATVALTGPAATTPLPSVTDPLMAVYSGDANFQGSSSDPLSQVAVTNSASYATLSLAPDEIVTLFGSNLGSATNYASPPADSLGGTIVNVTDSAGVTRAAQLFYVSAAQASILMPAGVASGPATVTVTNPNRAAITTRVVIGPIAPGIFTTNATGQGVPAAQIIRVHADGTQDAPQNVAVFDPHQNTWLPAPIDLSASTDIVYLLLYGTGIRHYSTIVTCTIGGNPVGVVFAGAQSSFAGLDQVNLVLPSSLRGAGTVNLLLSVDGTAANTVTLAFQ